MLPFSRIFNPFLIVGATELYLSSWLWSGGWPILAALLGWAGLSTFWAGIAYLLNCPALLFKHLPPLPRRAIETVLLPFFASARITARIGIKSMREPRTELAPGLWVGGWPLDGAPGLARLDLTAELPPPDTGYLRLVLDHGQHRDTEIHREHREQKEEIASLRMDQTRPPNWITELPPYQCVPMLDGAAPRPEDFARAVSIARAWRAEGRPILVHCAYGHGRSVMVCLAVLVAEGRYPTWQEAHAHVQNLRPRARMSAVQRAFLSKYLPKPAHI